MSDNKQQLKREQSRLAMQRLCQRREEAGLKRVTFWASPEVQDLLDKNREHFCTVDDMVNSMLRRRL